MIVGYLVYRCDECGKLLLADGGAFLAHKKKQHNSQGYGESKVVAVIETREKKYEFRDTKQNQREEWLKKNGIIKHVRVRKSDVQVYVIS